MAYQTYDVLHAMEQDAGIPLAELRVDGGAAANSFLLQFQSDITGVSAPLHTGNRCLGAAYLAGLAVGIGQILSEIRATGRFAAALFSPAAESEKIKEKLAGWHRGCRQARLISLLQVASGKRGEGVLANIQYEG